MNESSSPSVTSDQVSDSALPADSAELHAIKDLTSAVDALGSILDRVVDALPKAAQDTAPNPVVERLTELVSELAAARAFPLDKRELFAGLALMGLTGRMQPIQVTQTDAKKLVVDLAFQLADMAVERSAK